MTINEGRLDRGIRIVIALSLLSLTVVGPHTWWGLLGLLPLTTGSLGFCPLYALLKVSTAPADEQEAGHPKSA